MKKGILSLALIFGFTAYVFYVRTAKTDISEAPVGIVASTKPAKTAPATSTPPKKGSPSVPQPVNTGKYKDGSYTGNVADAYYGNVQVEVTVSGGKITDVQFLDHPHQRQTSVRINSRAMPYLISEAIAAQDANVDTVSGASFTSAAFRESLSGALAQAKV